MATIWRGAVTAIEVRGVTSATKSSPDEAVTFLTGVLTALFGVLLGAVLLAVRDRIRWLERCGGIYAVWAGMSGVVLGIALVAGPVWLWPILLILSALVAGLIAVEFFISQPRIAARTAGA